MGSLNFKPDCTSYLSEPSGPRYIKTRELPVLPEGVLRYTIETIPLLLYRWTKNHFVFP
jgi:hypothetical protein